MGTASCQVYVGGSRADALISLHLCFVKGGKVESPSGMKGAPNDIAEIALPRFTVRGPSSICLSPRQLPMPSNFKTARERRCSLAVYLLSDVPSQATCAPRKKYCGTSTEILTKPYRFSGGNCRFILMWVPGHWSLLVMFRIR